VIWAVLLLTKAFGQPVDEGGNRFRRIVNNDEKCVPLPRTNHFQFHGDFGRGEHSFAYASTHRSTGQLQALLAGEQVPRLWSGVCVHWDISFRAKVCFLDDDLVAGPGGDRGELVCFRDERSTFRPTTLGREREEPDLACCFHHRIRGSGGTLCGLFRREILEPPNKRTGRQRSVSLPAEDPILTFRRLRSLCTRILWRDYQDSSLQKWSLPRVH